MNIYQQYRYDNGLCLDCGERAASGKTRCYRCLQIIAARQRDRYYNDPEYREHTKEYQKKWKEKNREHVREYHRKWYDENYKSSGDKQRAKDIWYDGKYMSMAEISRKTGVPYSYLHKRVKYYGMSVGEAIMMYGKRG